MHTLFPRHYHIFIKKAKKAGKKIIIHQHSADFDDFYFKQCDAKKRKQIKKIFAMADIIIVLILIVIAVFAIKQTKKHMHGESPCCGGGSGTVKKVKEKHLDGPVMGTKTMKIKGMTCERVNNVTNAINKVAGASAKVSLKDKEAIISYDRELSNIELRKAVEDAGYEVISLS